MPHQPRRTNMDITVKINDLELHGTERIKSIKENQNYLYYNIDVHAILTIGKTDYAMLFQNGSCAMYSQCPSNEIELNLNESDKMIDAIYSDTLEYNYPDLFQHEKTITDLIEKTELEINKTVQEFIEALNQ